MARRRFPSDTRLAYQVVGGLLVPRVGSKVRIYTNAAATTLANIQTLGGVAIANAELTIDSTSRFPEFLGPDGVPFGPTSLFAKGVGAATSSELFSVIDRNEKPPSWRTDGGNGQSIPNNVITRYSSGVVREPTGLQAFASDGITIGREGIYFVSFGIRFTGNSALNLVRERYVGVQVDRNGAFLRRMAGQTSHNIHETVSLRASNSARLFPGDFITGIMFQNTGGGLNVDNGFGEVSFDGVLLSP